VVGFHRWSDAPKVVDYLRALHRHVFHFKVGAQVTKLNRQVEFHHLRAEALEQLHVLFPVCTGFVEEGAIFFGDNACEHIAKQLGDKMLDEAIDHVPDSPYAIKFVEVSEDGENGAIVEWEEYVKVHDAAAWAEKMRRITANKLKTSKSKKEGK
jgi:hypothetical protein